MGKDKRKHKGILWTIFRKEQQETPSKSSESDQPERASGDTYRPNPRPRPETERFEPSSENSPPASSADGPTVLRDRPDVTVVDNFTRNRDSTSTLHGQSEADQCRSSRPCQAPPDPKTSSTLGICNEHPPQPLQEQDEQALLQLGTGSLWKKAAESLDHRDREKLNGLVKSKREGQTADSPPDGQGEGPSAADVSLIISRAKRLEDEDKKGTWRAVLKNITQGALVFKSLGDTAVSFDKSGYAALGWSVVSFGLQVAANAGKAREFVLSSSEVVTGFMARYMEYEKYFRGQHAVGEFDRRVTKVYRAILLYVMALDDYLQQCEAERLGHAFRTLDDRSISQRKQVIDDQDAKVRDWLQIIMHKSNEVNFAQLRRMIDQSLPKPSQPSQECLRSLSFPEMEDRFNNIKSAAEGTSRDRSLLWIKGKPGSGKSTLLKYALGDANVASNIGDRALVLSFFFHGSSVELQRTPLGLFRSLLYQLLRQVPDAVPDVVAYFQERYNNMGKPDKKWSWSLNRLQDFFMSSLPKVLENRSVWLFVDALDECGEESAINLVKEFKSLVQKLPTTNSQLHICFTRRHFPPLDLDYGFEICVEAENKKDISTYAIEVEINAIPPDLNELYLGLVQCMEERSASLKLIQWICFATRPLSLEELRWAMVVDTNCPDRSLEEYRNTPGYISDNDEMKMRIEILSCGLVEIAQSSDEETSDKVVVQFIHQSVKEFFIEKGLSALDDSSTTADLVGAVHYQLSRTCISYLAMDEIGQLTIRGRDDLISEFPLLHYATTSWVSHVKQIEERRTSQVDLIYFARLSEALLRLCAQIYSILEPYSKDCPPKGGSIMHVASQYQLIGLLSVIIQRTDELNINARDDDGRTPLLLAAEMGHEAVVRLLLKTGKADIDARDNEVQSRPCFVEDRVYSTRSRGFMITTLPGSRTPLLWAAVQGHEDVVELLLNKANVDARDIDGRTPLSYAAKNGHTAVVQLLLNNANVDAGDSDGRTPLSLAAAAGHVAAVRLLLNKRADVELVDKFNRTPLSWAAGKSNSLFKCVDLGIARCRVGEVIWSNHLATVDRHLAVVGLLLAEGAQVSSKDKDGRTPLLWAAVGGHRDVIELLLAKGAQADSKDNRGLTPLMLAALDGNQAVVQLLLDTGKVDVDARDDDGCTPLSLAILRGNEAIMRLLQNSH
ncbi:uncharacterized protein PAC_14581 [Phialocephala subalpina]|uniref:Uncharacterized protein n=1 Tax=Phialocephala subalpina TaxID=576137 RepID=A0A1L7XI13_9HELO|nr:uncharacterized protein PAC_14581 [Phialocephala subalpina]